MQMEFISSSELTNVEGVEYLRIYLKPNASFFPKINGEEVEQNELLIKAPTMSNLDVCDIKKCNGALAVFQDVYNEKLSKEFDKLSEDEKNRLQQSIKQSDESSIKTEDLIKEHIRSLLDISQSCTERDKEFDKISNFLEKERNF